MRLYTMPITFFLPGISLLSEPSSRNLMRTRKVPGPVYLMDIGIGRH